MASTVERAVRLVGNRVALYLGDSEVPYAEGVLAEFTLTGDNLGVGRLVRDDGREQVVCLDGGHRIYGAAEPVRQETELPVIEQVMVLEQAAKEAVLGLVRLYDKAPVAERELAAQAVDGLAEYVAMAMTAIDSGATDLSDLEG